MRADEDNKRFIAVIKDEWNRFNLNIPQIVFTDFMSGAEGGVPDPSPPIGSCSGTNEARLLPLSSCYMVSGELVLHPKTSGAE